MRGNLRVKLPPSTSDGRVDVRAVEPEVIGFTGEGRVIESVSSIVEISFSHSTFLKVQNSERKITYIEAS